MKSNDLIPFICYGAGGHAAVVESAIIQGGEYYMVGVADDNIAQGTRLIHAEVLGGKDELAKFLNNGIFKMHVAVGNNCTRHKIIDEMKKMGFEIITIKHPSAIVEVKAEINSGCFLSTQSVVGARAKIGHGCIVNTSAVVEHDCVLGDCVHICPGAHLAGDVEVGEMTMVGTGAAVIPGITIGKNCTIGAGAVVIKDVKSNATVVGNPGRVISI